MDKNLELILSNYSVLGLVVLVEHGLECVLVLESARDGATNLGTEIVQGPQTRMQRHCVLGGTRRAQGILLGSLLLALLESPEIVLDEEGCVEFANRNVIVVYFFC